MPVATRAAWGGNRCLSAFSWSSTVPTRTGWLGSGPPRWAMSSRWPRRIRYLERLLPRAGGTRGGAGRRGGQDQRPGGPRAEHLVPCCPGCQGGQEPAAPRHPRQWRADGPDRDSQEAGRRGSQPAGRPGRHHHWRIVRGRARPLRGRDEGPGRQRVRYQLTAAAEARSTQRLRPRRWFFVGCGVFNAAVVELPGCDFEQCVTHEFAASPPAELVVELHECREGRTRSGRPGDCQGRRVVARDNRGNCRSPHWDRSGRGQPDPSRRPWVENADANLSRCRSASEVIVG